MTTLPEPLLPMQKRFAAMLPKLMQWIIDNGYEFTVGDAYAKVGHRFNSNHYIRLAIDLNLFKDGHYLQKTSEYKDAGEFWESIGGAWGGRFDDGNHFSVEYMGRK